jgi:8-oxo-dGTP diphosphatase
MAENEEAQDFINLGIVTNNKEEVLMIRRVKKETGSTGAILEWAFPGGKQRLQETRKQCVEREILDETGYSVEASRELSSRIHPEISVFIVYHLCYLKSDKPVTEPKEPDEIAEVKWIKKQDIKNFITTNLDEKVSKELKI